MRILLVEDDAVLGDGLVAGLGLSGHVVDWLVDGREAIDALGNDRFAVAILDLSLPGASGQEVLRAWRRDRERRVPVLVLTAHADDDGCIAALDGGADDYLAKPVDLGVLEARLRALVRRSNGHVDDALCCGDLSLERGARIVRIDREPLALSAYEFRVLETLIERPGHIIARERLEADLYGWNGGPAGNSLHVLVHKLRRKIGAWRIETVRGMGYRLVS